MQPTPLTLGPTPASSSQRRSVSFKEHEKISFVMNIIFVSIFQFVGLVAALLRHFFAGNDEPNFFRGEEVEVVEEDVAKLLGSLSLPKVEGGLKYLIHTSPGEGLEVLQVKLPA